MRKSLIIFGVIFLVMGGLLYLIPMQEIKADTTTVGNGDTDVRTSSARVTVPIGWAYASIIIGFALLVLGLIAPSPTIRDDSRHDSKKDSYKKVVESKEDMDIGDGNNRKVVRVHTEKYRTRTDD